MQALGWRMEQQHGSRILGKADGWPLPGRVKLAQLLPRLKLQDVSIPSLLVNTAPSSSRALHLTFKVAQAMLLQGGKKKEIYIYTYIYIYCKKALAMADWFGKNAPKHCEGVRH